MPPSPPIFSAGTTTPADARTAATPIATEMLEVNPEVQQASHPVDSVAFGTTAPGGLVPGPYQNR